MFHWFKQKNSYREFRKEEITTQNQGMAKIQKLAQANRDKEVEDIDSPSWICIWFLNENLRKARIKKNTARFLDKYGKKVPMHFMIQTHWLQLQCLSTIMNPLLKSRPIRNKKFWMAKKKSVQQIGPARVWLGQIHHRPLRIHWSKQEKCSTRKPIGSMCILSTNNTIRESLFHVEAIKT